MRAMHNMDAYEVDDAMKQTSGLFLNDDYKEVKHCHLMLYTVPQFFELKHFEVNIKFAVQNIAFEKRLKLLLN